MAQAVDAHSQPQRKPAGISLPPPPFFRKEEPAFVSGGTELKAELSFLEGPSMLTAPGLAREA